MSVTVLTGARIAEHVGKFPNLGIDTFVHERDYNQAENSRVALEQDLAALEAYLRRSNVCGECFDIAIKAIETQSDAVAKP